MIQRLKLSGFVLAIIVLSMSCEKKTISHYDLIQYLQDKEHGLDQTDSIGNVVYNVMYRSSDLMVWQDIGNQTIRNKSSVDSLRKEYSKYHYYLMNISVEKKDLLNAAGQQYFSQLLQDVSFRMPDYVSSINANKDTLTLADYSSPRLYGLGNSTKILLAFEKKGSESEYEEIMIKGLSGGQLVFRFNTKDINEVPLLNFDQK